MMTTDEKLDANRAAMQLLERTGPTTTAGSTIIEVGGYRTVFDMFHDSCDVLSVVKKLGEKHGLSIVPSVPLAGWSVMNEFIGKAHPNTILYDTYEDALAAAVLEVMNE